MRLTQFRLCPFSRGVRLILGEFGLQPELVDVNPWRQPRELMLRNPGRTLPVLDLADGSSFLGFYAIAEFCADVQRSGSRVGVVLSGGGETTPSDRFGTTTTPAQPTPAEDYPNDITLLPDDLEDRAEVRRLVDWFALTCNREVTQELLIEKVRSVLERDATPPNAAMLRAARENRTHHLAYLGFLTDNRNWIGGDRFSLADIAAAAHLSTLDFIGEIDWAAHPQVKDWYQRIKSRPSFRPLLTDRVPGLIAPPHYADLDF
jgi:glutathione S-transferase